MIFQLNPTLTETKTRHILSVDDIAQKITRIQAEKDNSLKIIRHLELPSFLYALSKTYSFHQSISFGPHDLWYVMLTEIARTVNANSERFRELFTKSTEKVNIIVPTSSDEYLPLDVVMEELQKLVPIDLSLFLPEFSTHTPESKVACAGAFADTVKSYYNYMTFCCGIKNVEVRGTPDDWGMFCDRIARLYKVFSSFPEITDWLKGIWDRADKILGSILPGGQTDFYKTIFSSTQIGSGGELSVDGWFVKDFFMPSKDRGNCPKIENFPMTWSVVPFENLETKRKFNDIFGCFYSTVSETGLRTPQYGRFTFEIKSN